MRLVIPLWLFFLISLLLPNILYANSNQEGLGQLRDRIKILTKDLSDKEKSKLGP